MISPGRVVADVAKRSYRIERELDSGGQGTVFEVVELASGSQWIVKAYHPSVATKDAEKRLDALIALNLSSRSPALCAPTVRLASGYGVVGAIQPRAAGKSLEDLLQAGTHTFLNAVGIALALCRALAVLEGVGVGHGDLAASNIIVKPAGNYYEIYIIDLDNASVPGAPVPTFRGQDLYAAPELLAGRATASITSDRFSLAVLLYELLYGRHPFASALRGPLDFAAYVRALSSASWREDPITGECPDSVPGLPVGVLPREVHQLFRAALQVDPLARPSATTWERALQRVLEELYECGACNRPFANDPARYECPWCGAPAEVLELHIAGRRIPLAAMITVVGRDAVGGDASVSREHPCSGGAVSRSRCGAPRRTDSPCRRPGRGTSSPTARRSSRQAATG